MYLVIFCYWVGPVPYLELFGVGPVEKNTLYVLLSQNCVVFVVYVLLSCEVQCVSLPQCWHNYTTFISEINRSVGRFSGDTWLRSWPPGRRMAPPCFCSAGRTVTGTPPTCQQVPSRHNSTLFHSGAIPLVALNSIQGWCKTSRNSKKSSLSSSKP